MLTIMDHLTRLGISPLFNAELAIRHRQDVLGRNIYGCIPAPSFTLGSNASSSNASSSSGGGFGTIARPQLPQCVGGPFSDFFANNLRPSSGVASQYNVDVSLLLGLAAAESGYGTSSMARAQNNPFGATPGGFNTPGVTYNSLGSAWQSWGNQWGPRVRNVGSDVSLFIGNLTIDNQGVVGAVDQRGPYNTQNVLTGGDPNWANLVAGSIAGVRQRLPVWQAGRC